MYPDIVGITGVVFIEIPNNNSIMIQYRHPDRRRYDIGLRQIYQYIRHSGVQRR